MPCKDRLDADLALGGGPALVPELWELLAGAGPAADGRLSWFWRLRGLYGEQAATARELLAAVGAEPPAGLAGGVRPVRDQRALG